MSDKYTDAIAYLKVHPEKIMDVWGNPSDYDAGCLFAYATSNQHDLCGCLTQVRKGDMSAFTPALTDAIRADERIPVRAEDNHRRALGSICGMAKEIGSGA
jgi:hypothetical protein